MFDIKDAVCLAGSAAKPCEDAIGYGADYCFVIDGASGLSGIQIVAEQSDAAWFAAQLKEKLCTRLDYDKETPSETIFGEIIGELKEIYCQTAAEKGMELPDDSPSAGIAMFRIMKNEIVFWGLGDCMGMAEMKDGTVAVLKDSRLGVLDGAVLEEMSRLHRTKGISVLEARDECNDLLLINRNKRNKEGGYWILDLSGAGIRHAVTASWPVDSVKTVFACSDGFAQLADTFHMYGDYNALLDAVRNTSISELCDTLFAAQDQDPQANSFPRFKLRDDTSCLWGETEEGVLP